MIHFYAGVTLNEYKNIFSSICVLSMNENRKKVRVCVCLCAYITNAFDKHT